MTSEFDPVYGLPKAYFGAEPAWVSILNMIPLLMVLPASPIYVGNVKVDVVLTSVSGPII